MLTQSHRNVLDRILDEIIPCDARRGIPGAGALGVTDFILSATRYDANPAQVVETVIHHVLAFTAEFEALDPPARVAVLQAVEAVEPDAFSTLVRLTYMGYYSRPDIRPLFGVGAHPVHPDGYDVEAEPMELLEELTAPVRERGPSFRSGSFRISEKVGEGGG